MCRDSAVGTAIIYGLEGPGIEARLGGKSSANAQTNPAARPASCTVGTGSLFLGLSVRGMASPIYI